MLNRYVLPACLTGVTLIALAAPSYGADALLPDQVAKIAKFTAVRIEPAIAAPGSGVIVGRYSRGGEKVYSVLTAAHVVKRSDDDYKLISPWPVNGKERQKIQVDNRDIKILPGLDLALITFRSKLDYKAATIGDSDLITEGSGVYVTGFPDPGAAIKRRVFQFTGALVSSRLDGEAVEGEADKGPLAGGYSIVYTNVTRTGMSGGPVYDVAGRLIGIHGMGDREVLAASTPEGRTESFGDKTGFNLAIPIKSFLSKIPNPAAKIGARYDGSPFSGFLAGDSSRNGGITRIAPLDPRSMRTIVEEEPANDMPPAPMKRPRPRF